MVVETLEGLGTDTRRGGAAILAVGFSGAVAIFNGAAMLLVPWQDPRALSYAACHASAMAWYGCVAGYSPFLPFGLLGGGALSIVLISRLRRRR